MRITSGVVASALALAGSVLLAGDMPFWKDGVTPETVRPASAVARATIGFFSSRTAAERTEQVNPFDSSKGGLLLIIR